MAARMPREREEPYATEESLAIIEALVDAGSLPRMPTGCPKKDPSDPACYACKACQDFFILPLDPSPEVMSDEEACALVSRVDEWITANKQSDADGYLSNEPSTTEEPGPPRQPSPAETG